MAAIPRRGGVAITFPADGIEDRRHGAGLIPWKEIDEFSILMAGSSRVLSLRFLHPDRYTARLSAFKRLMTRVYKRITGGEFRIVFIGLKPGIDDAVRYIQTLRPGLLRTG